MVFIEDFCWKVELVEMRVNMRRKKKRWKGILEVCESLCLVEGKRKKVIVY